MSVLKKNTGIQDVEFVEKEFDGSEILHDCIELRKEMLIHENNRNTEEEEKIRTFEVVTEDAERTYCKIVSFGMFAVETEDGIEK